MASGFLSLVAKGNVLDPWTMLDRKGLRFVNGDM